MEGTTTPGSHSSGRSPELPEVPEPVLRAIEAHLRQREERRDEIHQRARRLRRLAQHAMIRVHEGHAVDDELADLRRLTEDLRDYLARDGPGDEPLARDAIQESVEASLLGAVVHRRPLPGPEELFAEPETYLLGLGDLVGELRRVTLDLLARGELEEAEGYVRLMDAVYRALMRFDTTRSIVALKPKQDVARALLERTRGDVTMARLLARAQPGNPTRVTGRS